MFLFKIFLFNINYFRRRAFNIKLCHCHYLIATVIGTILLATLAAVSALLRMNL